MITNNTGYFDEHIAATYDDDAEMFDPDVVNPTVNFLADLAGRGRALEFGIGTGRIAIPLAGRGISVHGIDVSQPMLDKLAEKPAAAGIEFTAGDIATTSVGSGFSLVYLVFNTIMNLTTQAEQVACFRNAAAHLKPGGYFVIEVMLPELQLLPFGESNRTFDLSENHIGIDEYDIVKQRLVSHHYKTVNGQAERFLVPMRYVWPAELDLMALHANLTLDARYSDWQKAPFTNLSTKHVSVWKALE